MHRILHSIVVAAVLLCVFSAAPARSGTTHDLNIASGTLTEVLRSLADQVHLQMVFYVKDAQTMTVGPLRGRYTAEQALDELLKGSDLEYQYVDERTISVRKKLPSAKGVSSDDSARGMSGTTDVGLRLAQAEPAKAAAQTEGDERREVKSADENTAKKQEETSAEVLVTGSRIRSLLGESDFTPTLTFNRADIERAGVTSIGELGRLIPQAYTQGSYDGIGFGGQSQGVSPTSDGSTAAAVYTSRSTFNLRGLGTQNTLILVDGRRLPASGVTRGNDGNDLAAIPISSIERIDVLTDGASAIYGSDAVGGVINIILRKNYNGTEANVTYENTFDTDTAVRTFSLSHSRTLGKFFFTVAGNYQDRNAFAARDRYFTATDDWASLGANSPTLAIFNSFAAGVNPKGAGIVQSADFSNLPGRDSMYAVIPDGATGALRPATDYVSVEGDDFGVPSYSDDRAQYVNIISPQTNRGLSTRMSYNFNPRMQWFVDARYSDTETDLEGLPVNYRNYMFVPADYPGNPFGVDLYMHKTFWELGNIQGAKQSKTSSMAAATGLRGEFGDDWRYEASFDWGRSVLRDAHGTDPVIMDQIYNEAIENQALVLFYDSRTSAPNNRDLLLSMLLPANTADRNVDMTWATSVDGPVFTLPAGHVRVAAGAEHRRESAETMRSIPDPDFVNQSLLGSFDRNIDSAYTEVLVPLVAPAKSVPLLHRLDATAAVRYDRYSDIGGDYSPRFGVQYRPFSWMLLRGTRNYAFRAPGLQALYRPVSGYDTEVTPFDELYDPVREEFVEGNVHITIGGNLGLKPERSTSDNLGIVLESPFKVLEGLSVSVDFLQLNYRDRISENVDFNTILELIPGRATRGTPLPGDAPGTPGPIIGIDWRALNIARNTIRSVDYQIKYNRPTRVGNFDIRGAATVYDRYVSQALPGAAFTDTGFRYPTRYTWQGYWNRGALGLGISGFMQEHEFSNVRRIAIRYNTAVEWNAHLSYDFGRGYVGGASGNLFSGMKLALTVFNVLDREPPHPFGNAGFAVTDPRMRRYTLSLTKNF